MNNVFLLTGISNKIKIQLGLGFCQNFRWEMRLGPPLQDPLSNNFVNIFNELYLFSMDFALCLTLDILASLVNVFFLVHDSEMPN
jgi:hypothetical protein